MGDKVHVDVSSAFYITVAAMLLMVPIKWCTAFFAAAMLHELGHYITLRITGGRLCAVHLGFQGAELITQHPGYLQEALCAISGPIFGGVLILAGKTMPCLALCAGVQTLFNLLPIYPLDGGRFFRCILRMVSVSEKTVTWIDICLFAAILCLIIIASLRYALGIWPFFLVMLLYFRRMEAKIPCKLAPMRVQ